MSDRQLIADLLSALEYHTEQTRPIEFSRVAIEAARGYLKTSAQPAQAEARPCHVFNVTKNGALTEWEPTTMAFALPDGKHALYTAPQQAEAVPPDVVRDAERWRTFLATRPANTHAVINDAIDAAMAKGERS